MHGERKAKAKARKAKAGWLLVIISLHQLLVITTRHRLPGALSIAAAIHTYYPPPPQQAHSESTVDRSFGQRARHTTGLSGRGGWGDAPGCGARRHAGRGRGAEQHQRARTSFTRQGGTGVAAAKGAETAAAERRRQALARDQARRGFCCAKAVFEGVKSQRL
jgi:hypothetical protein